jgi:hypothetical protein
MSIPISITIHMTPYAPCESPGDLLLLRTLLGYAAVPFRRSYVLLPNISEGNRSGPCLMALSVFVLAEISNSHSASQPSFEGTFSHILAAFFPD